jgi:hypothetical protein
MSSRSGFLRKTSALLALATAVISAEPTIASTYVTAHIADVTFYRDSVLIRMENNGLPTVCTGTAQGWMRIAPENKSMAALVLGLLMRGDLASTVVTVYGDGVDSSGYCGISQIDPQE